MDGTACRFAVGKRPPSARDIRTGDAALGLRVRAAAMALAPSARSVDVDVEYAVRAVPQLVMVRVVDTAFDRIPLLVRHGRFRRLLLPLLATFETVVGAPALQLSLLTPAEAASAGPARYMRRRGGGGTRRQRHGATNPE